MRDISVSLIGARMADPCAKCLTPEHRLALVAAMTEITAHRRYRGRYARTMSELPPKPLQASTSLSQPTRSITPSGRRIVTPATRPDTSACRCVTRRSVMMSIPVSSQAVRSRSTSSRPERLGRAVHAPV